MDSCDPLSPSAVCIAALALLGLALPGVAAAYEPQLTRYPYLTDVVGSTATVNWATDRSRTSGRVKYGELGVESCTAHAVTASRTSITVNGVSQYQWRAQLPDLRPGARYCYRVEFGTATPVIDLLGADPSPSFQAQLPAGAAEPFSFAVLGDWGAAGDAEAGADNRQADLMTQLAQSGVRFAVGTGDTAYPSGTPDELRRPSPDGHQRERRVRAAALEEGGRLDPVLQRSRQPRLQQHLRCRFGRRRARPPARAAATRWRPTAASTGRTRRAIQARGTRSTPAMRVSMCWRRLGAARTTARRTSTRTTTTRTGRRRAPSTSGSRTTSGPTPRSSSSRSSISRCTRRTRPSRRTPGCAARTASRACSRGTGWTSGSAATRTTTRATSSRVTTALSPT